MVKRHHQIDFAAGALVFPGGKTHAGDDDPRWEARTPGLGRRAAAQAAAAHRRHPRGLRGGRHPAGPARGRRAVPRRRARRRGARRHRPATGARSSTWSSELDLYLDLEALTVFARWITPPLTPRRFDTWFYVARAPEEQLAVCDGSETVDAEWIAPAEALRLGEAGERTVIFPTRMNLQLLAEASQRGGRGRRGRGRASWSRCSRRSPSGDGERVLVIPPNAGYGAVVEPLSRADVDRR